MINKNTKFDFGLEEQYPKNYLRVYKYKRTLYTQSYYNTVDKTADQAGFGTQKVHRCSPYFNLTVTLVKWR